MQVEMYKCKLKYVPVHENHGIQLHTCNCMHVLCDMWYVGYHRLGIPRKVRLKRPKHRVQYEMYANVWESCFILYCVVHVCMRRS